MFSIRCTTALLVVAFLASVSCAEGVTWIKINGQSDATISVGQPIVITMDCSAGGEVIMSPFLDTNGNGVYDSSDQPLGDTSLCVDNSPKDEDSRVGYLQQTEPANVSLLVGKPILLVATEFGSGTTVSCRGVFQPTETAQGVRGHLSNADGTPAPGQTVWAAYTQNIDFDDPTDTPYKYGAVTDGNGDFVIYVPQAGAYLVGTGQGGSAPLAAYVVQGSFVEGVNLKLPPSEPGCQGQTYTLSGTITDSQNRPIPFVQISAHDNNWNYQKDFSTDLQGNYSVQLPSVSLSLRVRLNGYMPDQQYSVNLTSDSTLNMKMHRAQYYITGIIRNAVTNEPLPNAGGDISLNAAPYPETSDGASMSGRYLFWTDAGSAELEFEAWLDSYEKVNESLTISANTTHDVNLTPMSAVVSGRVRDDRVQNVGFAYVQAINRSRSHHADPTALTNEDGTYSLNLTPGDKYDIIFSKDGWQSQTYTIVNAADGETTLPDETLHYISDPPVLSDGLVTPTSGDSSTTYTFQVTYTDQNNDPPGSVQVYIDGTSHNMAATGASDSTYTDGAQYAYPTHLPGGPHKYRFEAIDSHGVSAHHIQGELYEHQGPCVQVVVPPNDNCADALTLAAPDSWTIDLTGATRDEAEPDGCYNSAQHTLWYRFSPSTFGRATFTAQRNGTPLWYPAIDVFEGNCAGGFCWTPVQAEDMSDDIWSIFILDEDHGWAVGDGGFMTSKDDVSYSVTTADLFSVFPLDGNNVWIAGAGGTILHTTNSGQTWSPQASGVSTTLRSVKFRNATEGLVVGDGGVILGTTDGGTSWDQFDSGTTADLKDFNEGGKLVAVGAGGLVLTADDAATHWDVLSVPTSQTLRCVSFDDSRLNGWIVGDGGAILHTTNGGSSWSAQTSGVTANLNSAVAISTTECRAVGDAGVALHTTDGGLTWQQETTNTTRNIYCIAFPMEFGIYACGAGGLFLWGGGCQPRSITCSNNSVQFVAVPGESYLIRLGSQSATSGLADASFSFTPCSPPSNDNCEDAIAIDSLPFTTDVNLSCATVEVYEPEGCYNPASTVWYRYTAQVSQTLKLEAKKAGTSTWACIDVFTGACGSLSQDQRCTSGPLIYPVQAGQTYYFRVGIAASDAGVYTFSVDTVTPSPNDNCVNAAVIDSLPFTASVDLTYDTREPGEPDGCYDPDCTVWYSYTAQESGTLRLESTAYIDVFTGACGSLSQNQQCATGSVNYEVQAGQTYYIRLGTSASYTGVYTLSARIVVPPPNDTCAGAEALTSPASWVADLSLATVDPAEPTSCHGNPYQTIWYTYTAAQDGRLNITATAEGSWLDINIFRGECSAGLCWQIDHIDGADDLRSIQFLEAQPDGEASVAWVVGDNGFIAYPNGSPDSGTTNDLFSVFGLDANLVWAAGEGGTILHSINGGADWSPQTSGVTSTLRSIKFRNLTEGILVGDGGVILGTPDGGASWSPVPSGTTADLNCFTGVPPANDSLFTVGDGGTVLKMDAGAWTPVSVPTTSNLRGISFDISGSGWIVGDGGVILHTSDGGTTWAAQTSGVTTNLYDVAAISSLECWAVGAGGTMLHTQDGENWTNQSIVTTEDIYSLSFGNAQSGLACGSNGFLAMMADCSLERIECGYGSVSRVVESGKYHIRISSAGNKTGLINGTLVFIPCTLPTNDDCTDAQVIASVPFHASVDLTGATKWSEEPRGCFTYSIATVWYKYTAQQSGSLSIQATKGDAYGEIEVFTGACDSLQQNQTCEYGPITYPVQAGQTYYIRVGAEANALGVYDVSVSSSLTNCLDASAKSVWPEGTIVPGDTLSYEVSVRNDCGAQLSNVTVSDAIPADTTYVPGSTKLNGAPVSDPSPGVPPFAAGMPVNSEGGSPGVVGANATAEVTFQARVSWDAPNAAVITNTAQIMANESALISTSVSNTVSVLVGPPDNDECANAKDVTSLFPYYDEVDIAGATISPDEPVGSYEHPPYHTIWYKCVPAETGWLSFYACTDVSWLETDVFKGSCGNLEWRGGGYYSSQVLLSAGESYLIRVGSWDQAGGIAQVSMDFTPATGLSAYMTVWPPGNAPWGRELTYSIRTHNDCDVSATGCRVNDVIPAGLTYVPNSTTLNEAPIPDVGGQPPFAGDMDISSSGQGDGVIASGAEAVVSFRATVSAETPHGTPIENSATAQADTPSPASVTATATVTAVDPALIPANDDCAMAKLIPGLPYEDSEDISWATIAMDEPEAEWWGWRCTVWYRFVPTEDADMVVRAVGEGFSPVITIFSGSCSSPTYVSTYVSGGGSCTPGGSCFVEYDACARVTAGQTYLIRVGSQSETAGLLTVTVTRAPDLVMNAVSGPAQASPGQRISVSRSVVNVGDGPATGEWYDAFYLSSDDQLDEGDYYLGYVERVRELNPGEGYDGQGDNLVIPASTPPGLYWILGYTDYGDYVWEGVAEGNNGRKSDTQISVILDTTSPTVPVITQPNGGEHIRGGASYVISWTPATDDIISPESIRIRLEFNDGSGWTLITPEAPNTGSFWWDVPALNSTSCRVRATAFDLSGNESQPDESDADFTIDSTPPSTPVVILPNGGEAYAAGTTQQITWTPSTDNLTSQSDISITLEIPSGDGWDPQAGMPNTGHYDWQIPWWVDNAEARIRLTATDQVGNTSGSDESDAGFLIDNQAPALQITQGPDENAWQQANTAHFEWSATDNHCAQSDIRYSYSTDWQTWTDWSTTTSVDLSSLADGWHSLEVKAKDAVGNENMVVRSFGVDATPPDAPVVTDDGQCTTATDSLHATWYSYDPGSPIAEYNYAVGTSPTDPGSGYLVEWTSAGTATEVTAGGLSLQEGATYYFYVKARDTVGMESGVGVSDGIEVRTTPLQVTDVIVSELGHTAATIAWTTNQPATSQVEYGLTDSYGESTGRDLSPTTGHEVVLSGLSPETLYHFRVKSDDGCQEAMSADNTFTTETAPAPDLRVSGFDVPTSTSSLATLTVSWRVKNEGLGDAAGTWFDGFYLSADQNLDEGDVVLAKVSPCGPLAASEEYAKSTDLHIPLSAPGLRYLILKTDADGSVAEGDETDNTVARPLDIVLAKQMIAAPSQISLRLDPGVPVVGEIQIGNLGTTALTEIAVSVINAAPNVSISAAPASTLEPLTVQTVSYSVTAADESVLSNSATVQFTSGEGADASVRFDITITPRQPRLEASPPSLVGSMLRGSQSTIECEVANTGGAAAGEVQVRIPEADWLSLVTPADLGTLEPGDKAKVGLALRPASDLPLGPHSGTVIVSGSNSSVTIPFTFTCVSDQRGDLRVYAEDEFYFFADDHPRVAGAKVELKDAFTGATVAQGVTGSDGVCLLQSINEGYYNLEMTAEKHNAYRGVAKVIAGQVREIHAFLSRQLVTYVWKVEPVGTEDHYRITLEALFETHVPAPVVTVEPAYLDLRTVTFDAEASAVVDYTITNHGLIAADNNVFDFRQHQDYEVTPLTTNIGRLAAKSSVVVPVTIRKLNTGQTATSTPPSGLKAQEDVPEGCWIEGYDTYEYVCVGNHIQMVPVYIPTLVCPPGVPYPWEKDIPGEHITIIMPWYYEPLQCEQECSDPDGPMTAYEIPFPDPPKWPGSYRLGQPIRSSSGERLEVWWIENLWTAGHYELRYYKPGAGNGLNDGKLIGKCMYDDGCNEAWYVVADSDRDGSYDDCFVWTTWTSWDYGTDDPEPNGDPPDGMLDSYTWKYDVVTDAVTKTPKKWAYICVPPMPGPPDCPRGCRPSLPGAAVAAGGR